MSRLPPRVVEHVAAAMDTTVSIQIAVGSTSPGDTTALLARARNAFRWFEEVEAVCSRFDPDSELSALSMASTAGTTPKAVSPLLFEVLRTAHAVAAISDGAFDPTLATLMQARGFDRHWRTGQRIAHTGARATDTGHWRDLVLDADRRTVSFRRPLTLDLGGIAKGFAIDLAARALADLPHIAINAGGDVYARGRNPNGSPWRIGVRAPRRAGHLVAHLEVTDAAVCTSADDQRRSADGQHHLLDPHTRRSAATVAAVTVVAPHAVIADALATAAFVLGPVDGLALLEREGVQGLIVDAGGTVLTTTAVVAGAWTLTGNGGSRPSSPAHAPR